MQPNTGIGPLDSLSLINQARRSRQVWYVAHPLRPTDDEVQLWNHCPEPRGIATTVNLNRAMRWLAWLRRRYPAVTFIAPWIASVLAGADDADAGQRDAGMLDADAVVARCDGVVLCGGRVSSGMARERDAAMLVVDLTSLGAEPPR